MPFQMLVTTMDSMREEKKTEKERTMRAMQKIIESHWQLLLTKSDLKRRFLLWGGKSPTIIFL